MSLPGSRDGHRRGWLVAVLAAASAWLVTGTIRATRPISRATVNSSGDSEPAKSVNAMVVAVTVTNPDGQTSTLQTTVVGAGTGTF